MIEFKVMNRKAKRKKRRFELYSLHLSITNIIYNLQSIIQYLNINKIGYNKYQIVLMPLSDVLTEINEQTMDMEKDEVDEL